MKLLEGEFPIFSGKVGSVSAILEEKGEYTSVVDFYSAQDQQALDDHMEEQGGKLFFKALMSVNKPEGAQSDPELESLVTRALVPLRLDPAVVNGSVVKTKFANYEGGVRAYELEIVQGPPRAGGDVFAVMADMGRRQHTGFKYIKILDS